MVRLVAAGNLLFDGSALTREVVGAVFAVGGGGAAAAVLVSVDVAAAVVLETVVVAVAVEVADAVEAAVVAVVAAVVSFVEKDVAVVVVDVVVVAGAAAADVAAVEVLIVVVVATSSVVAAAVAITYVPVAVYDCIGNAHKKPSACLDRNTAACGWLWPLFAKITPIVGLQFGPTAFYIPDEVRTIVEEQMFLLDSTVFAFLLDLVVAETTR